MQNLAQHLRQTLILWEFITAVLPTVAERYLSSRDRILKPAAKSNAVCATCSLL